MSSWSQARDFLSKLGDLSQTQIFAKIENVEVSSKAIVIFLVPSRGCSLCEWQKMRYGQD